MDRLTQAEPLKSDNDGSLDMKKKSSGRNTTDLFMLSGFMVPPRKIKLTDAAQYLNLF